MNRGILVVEDERIVAKDIEKTLSEMGYPVAGIASSGEEAVVKALELHPSLVLMDINLGGGIDGIEAARRIQAAADVPVVFVTASCDAGTVARTQEAAPLGYLVKPFYEGSLRAVLESAWHQHDVSRLLRERERLLAHTLHAMADAVVTAEARIAYLNPVAEQLTGWSLAEARGREVGEVVRFDSELEPGVVIENPLVVALRDGVQARLAEGAVLVTRRGQRVPVEATAAPILDSGRVVIGCVILVRDVTERRHAESEIRRLAEMRERVAVEATGMGVWDLDLRSGELIWSEGLFRMLGYQPAPNGRATGEMCWKLLEAAADLPAILAALDTAREERALFSVTPRLRRADDGRTMWARAFGRFLYDEGSGEPIRFVGISFDETERHEAEDARRDAEERLGLLVQGVREYALIAFDAHGRVVNWNEGAERIFGYRAADALGLDRSALYPPDKVTRAARELEDAADKGSVECEGWLVRKDGSSFWAAGVVAAQKDERGGVEGFLTVTQDLTQRRAAAERFRLALEASPSGMVMVDSSGTIVLLNREAERLFGYARDELIGRPVEALLPIELRAGHRGYRIGYASAPTARRMGGGRDLCGVRKDGSAFPIEVGLMPVQGEKEPFVVASVIDITERKRAEQAVRLANTRIEERLADLESFSYTVSHDLRAPLRAIQGYARFVEIRLGDRADPTSRRMLERMREAALRMDHLIRDVLRFSQIPNEPLPTGPVDLDAVVAHVLANYPDVALAGVKVRGPLGRVNGQESLLMQILSNLLDNAVKFIPKERVPEIDVWTEPREEGMLRVVVQDNGVGIPSEHRVRIFLPFERLRPEDASGGTGIGLAIVKRAVERLGGRVGVESRPGAGSRFWFELPEVTGAP
ncbi:MAG: PAS domain S-box protein [Pseudomonadota bacterium]|nr:PAS domain S-box protein [Pseudomonadota bacterium]